MTSEHASTKVEPKDAVKPEAVAMPASLDSAAASAPVGVIAMKRIKKK